MRNVEQEIDLKQLDFNINKTRNELNNAINSREDLQNLCELSVKLDKLLEPYIRLQGKK